MSESLTLDDVTALAERVDVECKSALGRDGRGELPEDFWKTYSAMANGEGGVVWLGVQEKPRGHFTAVGLADVERVRKALWDNLHNRKQVSVCLLTDVHVQPVVVEGRTVLRVDVPRAPRRAKARAPGQQPLRRHVRAAPRGRLRGRRRGRAPHAGRARGGLARRTRAEGF